RHSASRGTSSSQPGNIERSFRSTDRTDVSSGSPVLHIQRSIAMERRQLGRQGLSVSSLGLGCMSLGIADVYTSAVRSDADAISLIHRALDLGVTFLDTANVYGDSEAKVGKALKGRRDGVQLATKFGFTSPSSGQSRTGGIDARPQSVRSACETSLQRLGVEQI